MGFVWRHFLVTSPLYRGAQYSFDEIFDSRGCRQGQKETKWPATAMKKPAALRRPALALQEPAPDHAATATHELQAEEELPFFLAGSIFLDKHSGALAARPTCLVPKV